MFEFLFQFVSHKNVEHSLATQVQEKAAALKQKEDELHTTAINFRQAETELEKVKAKTIELETQVALSIADVENHKVTSIIIVSYY